MTQPTRSHFPLDLAADRRGTTALGFIAGAVAFAIAVVAASIGLTLSGF